MVALQARRDQGSGLLRGQVVQGTCLCLDPWGNLHEGLRQGDQLYLHQTSGLTGYLRNVVPSLLIIIINMHVFMRLYMKSNKVVNFATMQVHFQQTN